MNAYNVIYFSGGTAKYTWSELPETVVKAFNKCKVKAYVLPQSLRVQAI